MTCKKKKEFQLECRDDQGDIVFDYRIGGGFPGSCIVYAKGILKSIDLETGIITLSLTQEQVIDKVNSEEITLECAGVHYKNSEVELAQFLIGDNVVAEFGWPQNDAIPRCGFLRKL